jgi:TonB family protein
MNRIILTVIFILTTSVLSTAQKQGAPATSPPVPTQEYSTQNETLQRLFVSGNEELIAMHLDEAIRLFDQGIALSPKEPVFWANKSYALMVRAVTTYNTAIYTKDEELKKSKIESFRKDARESVETSTKAVELIKALIESHQQGSYENREGLDDKIDFYKLAALRTRAAALWMFVTKVDQSYSSIGLEAFREYIAAETDAAQKVDGHLRAGQMMLIAGKFDFAAEEFQTVLASDAENVEALLGLGLSLVDLGYLTNDQAQLRQGLDYLKQFVDKAPQTHRLRASAEEALNYLNQPQQKMDVMGTVGTREDDGPRREKPAPTIQGGVVNGKALSLPAPPYPLIAKAAYAKGTIVIQVVIDEEGNVLAARAVSGHPLLQAVSVAAARRARFSPTKLSGQPVKVTGVITYNFVP